MLVHWSAELSALRANPTTGPVWLASEAVWAAAWRVLHSLRCQGWPDRTQELDQLHQEAAAAAISPVMGDSYGE